MKNTFKVPHTLILLLSMMLLAYLATWIVPQGFFQQVTLGQWPSVRCSGHLYING